MTKQKDEITFSSAAFYCVQYPRFHKAALECGYALAVHGSLADDFDMIAVPWVQDCTSIETLLQKFSDLCGDTIWKERHFKEPSDKPHGRITYTLAIYDRFYIDLSIIKPKK